MSAPAETAVASTTTFPDADFDGFLTRFSRDFAVQEKSTADPLTQTYIDNEGQPEPREVSKDVPLADVGWPVIPNLEIARRNGREIIVTEEQGNTRKVVFRSRDTDDEQTYRFDKRPCWTLVGMSDDTL